MTGRRNSERKQRVLVVVVVVRERTNQRDSSTEVGGEDKVS